MRSVRREADGHGNGRTASGIHRQQERWVSFIPAITINESSVLAIRFAVARNGVVTPQRLVNAFKIVLVDGPANVFFPKVLMAR